MKRNLKKILVLLGLIILLPQEVMAEEEYVIGNTIETVITDDKAMTPRIIIGGEIGYCNDFHKDVPQNVKYIKEKYDNEELLTLLYHGYPYNATGAMERYGINSDKALAYTQNAIWYHREGWDKELVKIPYVQELFNKIENEFDYNNEIGIDEKALYFHKKGDYKETSLIKTYGKKGKFRVKAGEDIILLNSNGEIASEIDIGESFILRKIGENNEKMVKVTIDGEVMKPQLIKYKSTDPEVQDLINVEDEVISFNKSIYISDEIQIQQNIKNKIPKTGDELEYINKSFLVAGLILSIVFLIKGKKF